MRQWPAPSRGPLSKMWVNEILAAGASIDAGKWAIITNVCQFIWNDICVKLSGDAKCTYDTVLGWLPVERSSRGAFQDTHLSHLSWFRYKKLKPFLRFSNCQFVRITWCGEAYSAVSLVMRSVQINRGQDHVDTVMITFCLTEAARPTAWCRAMWGVETIV